MTPESGLRERLLDAADSPYDLADLHGRSALLREAADALEAPKSRIFASGPQGWFFTDRLQLARDLVNAFDKEGDWTVTDLWNPTGIPTPPQEAK